jgi:hypothetical protein
LTPGFCYDIIISESKKERKTKWEQEQVTRKQLEQRFVDSARADSVGQSPSRLRNRQTKNLEKWLDK